MNIRPKPVTNNLNILVVEDERFITELYTRALKLAGYTVTSISDGGLALEKTQNKDYDVILLDIMLPSMNGIDLLHKLKDSEQQTTNSKVIITTNLDQKEEARAKIEQLADGYLIKAEVTPKELVQYVNQVLGI